MTKSTEIALRTEAERLAAEKAQLEETVGKTETLLVTANDIIERQQSETQMLAEGMRELQIAFETRGWKLLHGGVDQREFDGIDLDALKKISDELRSYLTGGSLAKRLIEVRANFVIGAGGVEYEGLSGAKRAVEDLNNQEKLFSTKGLQEIIRAQGTDGTVVILVNPATKKIKRLPLGYIDALYISPDDPEDILYIKERRHRITVEKPQGEDVEVWYRVDLNDSAEAKRRTFIKEGARNVKIDRNWVAVIDGVNGQIGHTLGTPDLIASLPWLERYNEYLLTQLDFAKALSAIAVQIKSKTTKAQAQTQAAIRGSGKAGMATTGDDTEIIAQKGGSDVGFDNGRALAAMAATGAEVSVVHALSDPGASGSSYGSASNLDSPTMKMVAARREALSQFLHRVFTLLGAPKATVKWPRVEDEATFRLVQAVGLLWGTGLFKPEELRPKFGELVDLAITGKAPDDVLIPNTKGALEAASEVKQEEAEATAGFAVNAQGQDNQGLGKMDDQTDGNRPDRQDEP